jgi:hypothetical protein
MKARLLALAVPLVLVACKKQEPAPAAGGSAAAASGAGAAAAAPVAPKGEALGILKDFEGKIAWVVKGKLAGPAKDDQKALNLALLVKEGKFRLDLPAGLAGVPSVPGAPAGGNTYLLGRSEEKKLYAVVDAQKQAILIDADKLVAQAEAMGQKAPGAGGGDTPTLKKTGKFDKVAGYSCEVWDITHKTSKMELCIAAGDTAWFGSLVSKMPGKHEWAAELTDGKHFPLRFVAFDTTGAEEGRVELASIEKKPVDAQSLEVPAGYQVVDLEQMMAGMMKGLAGTRGGAGIHDLKGLSGLPHGLPSAFVRPPAGGSPKPGASAKKR